MTTCVVDSASLTAPPPFLPASCAARRVLPPALWRAGWARGRFSALSPRFLHASRSRLGRSTQPPALPLGRRSAPTAPRGRSICRCGLRGRTCGLHAPAADALLASRCFSGKHVVLRTAAVQQRYHGRWLHRGGGGCGAAVRLQRLANGVLLLSEARRAFPGRRRPARHAPPRHVRRSPAPAPCCGAVSRARRRATARC